MRALIKNILAEKWYILALFFTAAFLRLYKIREFATFLGDQGRDAVIIKRLITFEHFPALGAPSSIGQIFLGPFYYYLVSPFLLLFNFDPVGLSVGVALMSIIGIVLTYYVVKEEINTSTAIILLLFITFSYPLIELARFSWNPNLLPFFSFFTLYSYYRLLKKPSLLWAGLFGAIFSFATQLHHLAVLLVVPVFITTLLYFFEDKKKILGHLKYVAIAIGSFIVFYAPLILFDIKNNFLNIKNLFKLLRGEGVIVVESTYISRLGETVHGFFHNLLQLELDRSLAYSLLFIFIMLSLVFIKRIKSNYFLFLHFINAVVFLFLFAALTSSRHLHYYGTVYMSFFVVFSYVLYEISHKKVFLKYTIPLIFIAIFAYTSAQKYAFFYNEPNNQIDIAKNIARSFQGRITAKKIQMVSIPPTDTDGHIRYFLEIMGNTPLAYESLEQPEELYAICFQPDCEVIGDPQWQIASFENKKIQQSWKSENVTIYKLVHGEK